MHPLRAYHPLVHARFMDFRYKEKLMQLSDKTVLITYPNAVIGRAIAVRTLAILLSLLPFAAHAEIIIGRVANIIDGDTLILADASNQQRKIRLFGIDAPETTQDFGQKAKAYLSALALSQQATADCRMAERSSSALCVVTVGGQDIGLELIRNGAAWSYPLHNAQQSAKERADYTQAEFMAKIHRHGLWDSKNPMPPWDWRRGRPED